MMVIDEVLDVFVEAVGILSTSKDCFFWLQPKRVARSLILFCKGIGELSGVETPGIGRTLSPSRLVIGNV